MSENPLNMLKIACRVAVDNAKREDGDGGSAQQYGSSRIYIYSYEVCTRIICTKYIRVCNENTAHPTNFGMFETFPRQVRFVHPTVLSTVYTALHSLYTRPVGYK